MPVYVTIVDPDAPADLPPEYDGWAEDAWRVMVPGVYAATVEYDLPHDTYTESGYVICYGERESRLWKSLGVTPGTSGSFYMPESCNMMGCPTHEPHFHPISAITGEWWGGFPDDECPCDHIPNDPNCNCCDCV